MLRIVKNICIYRAKNRNRPIVSIDGYDETVHDGPFRKCRDRQIVDGRSGSDLPKCVIKRME